MNKLAGKTLSFFERVNTDKLIKVFIFVYFIAGLAVSLFSNGLPDEYLYLLETSIISDLFREGRWIGADLTGTHGFIFKLPVAIFFIIFGKSLFIARLFNVYLACLFIFILYNFGKKLLGSPYWSFIFTLLTSTSYQFVRSVPAYLREIPALLSLIILLFYFHNNKKINLIHGLLLLLLLDAKEYVGIILGISLGLHFFVSLLRKNVNFYDFSRSVLLISLPSVLYIALMFYTNIIPYNDMMAKSLFIRDSLSIKERLTFNSDQTPILRSSNQVELSNLGMNLSVKPDNNLYHELKRSLGNNSYWKYFEKFGSPRTFTVTSIPKIIILIALVGAFRKFKREGYTEQLLFIFFIAYLSIYFFKSSIERYLLHLTPIIYYYFVSDLSHIGKNVNRGRYIIVLAFAVILTSTIFIFDNFILLPKVLINGLLFIAIIFYLKFKGGIKYLYLASGLIIYSFVITCLWLYGSYKFGTIHQYFYYGKDFEYQKISQYFQDDETYWYNGDLNYLYFNNNLRLEPRVDRLKYRFRKADIINKYNTPYLKFKPTENFMNELKDMEINNVMFITTTSGGLSFPYQGAINYFIYNNAFDVIKIIPLQNKKLLILKIASDFHPNIKQFE